MTLPSAFALSKLGVLERYPAAGGDVPAIDISGLAPGIHETDSLFFKVGAPGQVAWVMSRVCDHANGRLIRTGASSARCPLHGWQLDLDRLAYTNVGVAKETLPFEVRDGILRCEAARQFSLRVPPALRFGSSRRVSIRFLAHACLLIEYDGLRLITDPWLLGPCFMTGWWPALPPKDDALDLLCSADAVYISHNHPDHMHEETLSVLRARRPDVPVLVPAFDTASTVRPVREMGFSNVQVLEFNSIYRVGESPLLLSMLKSGDFRDDSGLYLQSDNCSCLLVVDAKALNGMCLPNKIDFLAASFAGGASAYPWCYEHHTVEERAEINRRYLGAMRKRVVDHVRASSPRIFMPYAGFFKEAAPRDAFIRDNNTKNSVDSIRKVLLEVTPGMTFVDPRDTDQVVLDFGAGDQPPEVRLETVARDPSFVLNDDYVAPYIAEENAIAATFSLDAVAGYFRGSGFRDEMLLYLLPSGDGFEPMGPALRVDFRATEPLVAQLDAADAEQDYAQLEGVRKVLVRARRSPLWKLIQQGQPWENLSIGFQARFERNPDVYESRFWYHFTNVYIGQRVTQRAGSTSA
jgi:CMP-N-acetylneuraminate monooxygenase